MSVISDCELNAQLVRELCSGRQFMETRQQFREKACAQEAARMRGHRSIKGLGKCIAHIPAHEFFLLREKYGDEAFNDREFLRDFQRLEPDLCPNKI
jgi:hypothetical protein